MLCNSLLLSGAAVACGPDIFDTLGDGSELARYRFNDDGTDLGGTYDGTFYNGTPVFNAGIFDNCFDFTGVSNVYLDTGITESLVYGVHLWVNVTTLGTAAYVIGDTTTNQGKTSVKAGTDGCAVWINNYYRTYSGLSSGWHHILVTSDRASHVDFYVDKVLQTKLTESTLSSIGTNVGIGLLKSGQYGAQKADHVSFLNRKITLQSEVDAFYNQCL